MSFDGLSARVRVGRWFGSVRFVHVCATGKLYLNGMDVLCGLSVPPRDPAALEPAVRHAGVVAARERCCHQRRKGRRATEAGSGADADVRQLSGEQARNLGPDRVTVVQHNLPTERRKARDLAFEGRVVGFEVRGASPLDLGFARFAAGTIERHPIERRRWAELRCGKPRMRENPEGSRFTSTTVLESFVRMTVSSRAALARTEVRSSHLSPRLS